jgi:SAM-dependent methyltransferase
LKSEQSWIPTKYVLKNGLLKASRDPAEVGIGSRLIGDLVARFYGDKLREHASGHLIDLGCGKVPLYAAYRDYVSGVTCVDWSKPEGRPSHLDYECDLSKTLPLDGGQYDTVILSDVLEHVAEPAILWSEIARITCPGGKLLMNTPFMHCLHEQPHDYYRFTAHALRRFAETNRFEVVSLQPIGGTPEVLADIMAKHLQFVPFVGKFFAQALQSITGWFIKIGPGASISARTSDAFPLGYAMVAVRKEDN